MALIECQECKTEISDKAESCPKCGAQNAPRSVESSAPVVAEKKEGGAWKWVIGIPVGLFAMVMIFGTASGESPEGKERAKARWQIDACWGVQGKKSLDASTAQFAGGMCEKMESDFRLKYKREP